MRQARILLIFSGVGLVLTGVAAAQAPPGPIAPVASQGPANEPPPPPPVKIVPRTNILGAWKLNRDESDDPKARSNQRKVNDPNQGHGGNSGPRIGFPGGGMGGHGMGGGQRGNGGPQKHAWEGPPRYTELIDPYIRRELARKTEKGTVRHMI